MIDFKAYHNIYLENKAMNKVKIFMVKYGLCVFPFSLALPLPLKYSSIALMILILTLLLKINFKSLRVNNVWIIITAAFFLIDPFMGFLTLEPDRIQIKETKLAYFFIPLLFYNSKSLIQLNVKRILYSFVLGAFFYVVYAWMFVAYFFNIKYPDWHDFSLTDGYLIYVLYNYLPGSIHHTYIGLYLLFSICVLLIYPIKSKGISNILIALFSFSLIYMGGKLTIMLMFFNFGVYLLHKKKIKVKYLIVLAILPMISFLAMGGKILASFSNSLGHRIDYYHCGLKLLKEKFIQGVGFKNIKKLINNCPELKFEEFIPHNSLIYEFLSNGILGFIIIGVIYYFFFRVFFKTQKFLLKIVVFNIFLVSLIEDLFYLQLGVFFIVTFISLLLYTKEDSLINLQRHK